MLRIVVLWFLNLMCKTCICNELSISFGVEERFRDSNGNEDRLINL